MHIKQDGKIKEVDEYTGIYLIKRGLAVPALKNEIEKYYKVDFFV